MAKAQYNREDIIDRAISLFWKNGFNGSSMQQIVAATGLKPGSIYYSFGNKEAVFKEALERYAQQSMQRIRDTLDTAPSVGLGICRHLERLLEESTARDFRSCFLVKSQLELIDEKRTLQAYAARKLSEIEALFQHYLEREYDRKLSCIRATSIMLHSFGMRVYGYQQQPEQNIRMALREGLPWLPWDEHKATTVEPQPGRQQPE